MDKQWTPFIVIEGSMVELLYELSWVAVIGRILLDWDVAAPSALRDKKYGCFWIGMSSHGVFS